MAISKRRSAIVRFWADKGMGNKEISDKLGLSESSVRRYLRNSNENKSPKVLLFDIETSTLNVKTFYIGSRVSIQHYKIMDDWFMLGYAAKMLDDKDVMSEIVTPEEAIARDDRRIVEGIWKLINDADVVIAHNAKRFDVRKINWRFAMHNLPKPQDFQIVDTLIQTQKHFASSSHKLDFLASEFSLRKKEHTEFALWVDCEHGDPKALAYMNHYNESDIWALQDLYLKIRPWVSSHPNLGLFIDDNDPMCPYCMSKDLVEDGEYKTSVSSFQCYRCQECGATPRGRTSSVSKEKRVGLLISTAR